MRRWLTPEPGKSTQFPQLTRQPRSVLTAQRKCVVTQPVYDWLGSHWSRAVFVRSTDEDQGIPKGTSKITVVRSSVTGRFVPPEASKRNPRETETEHYRKPIKKLAK